MRARARARAKKKRDFRCPSVSKQCVKCTPGCNCVRFNSPRGLCRNQDPQDLSAARIGGRPFLSLRHQAGSTGPPQQRQDAAQRAAHLQMKTWFPHSFYSQNTVQRAAFGAVRCSAPHSVQCSAVHRIRCGAPQCTACGAMQCSAPHTVRCTAVHRMRCGACGALQCTAFGAVHSPRGELNRT